MPAGTGVRATVRVPLRIRSTASRRLRPAKASISAGVAPKPVRTSKCLASSGAMPAACAAPANSRTTSPRRRLAPFQVTVRVHHVAPQLLALLGAAPCALIAPARARFVARHLAAAHLLAQLLALFPAHAPLGRRHRALVIAWHGTLLIDGTLVNGTALIGRAGRVDRTGRSWTGMVGSGLIARSAAHAPLPGLGERRAKDECKQQGREGFHACRHGTGAPPTPECPNRRNL